MTCVALVFAVLIIETVVKALVLLHLIAVLTNHGIQSFDVSILSHMDNFFSNCVSISCHLKCNGAPCCWDKMWQQLTNTKYLNAVLNQELSQTHINSKSTPLMSLIFSYPAYWAYHDSEKCAVNLMLCRICHVLSILFRQYFGISQILSSSWNWECSPVLCFKSSLLLSCRLDAAVLDLVDDEASGMQAQKTRYHWMKVINFS